VTSFLEHSVEELDAGHGENGTPVEHWGIQSLPVERQSLLFVRQPLLFVPEAADEADETPHHWHSA
jgi:hypothetical protein